jgi:hypothetical protein
MHAGSAREQAINAARRATMLKTTFASIRHMLDGDEFMPNQKDGSFPFASTAADEKNDDAFKYIDQAFPTQELASFKESGDEDNSINDFSDPFHTDEFYTSFPAFNAQSSIMTTDQSISDSKGLVSTHEDDFGFEEADFASNFWNEAANHSNGSSNDGFSKDGLSSRLNSSNRSRRKHDKNSDFDNVSATEVTETSNGSSMKRSTNSSGSSQRRTGRSKDSEEPETLSPMSSPHGDDALLTSPRLGARRRKSKSGNEFLSPRKVDSRATKADSTQNKSRKSSEQPLTNNPESIDLLKALALELTQKSNDGDGVDVAVLTDRIVTRVKELQSARPSREPGMRRSRSRGRLGRLDKQPNAEKGNASSKEKQSRSRSRSRPRMKASLVSPSVETKVGSKSINKSLDRLSSKVASSEDKEPPSRTVSRNSKDSHSSQWENLLNESTVPMGKARKSKNSQDAPRSPPAELLNEIKSPKAKSKKSKDNVEAPRSPPAELLNEIKSMKAKVRKSKGILDGPCSPPAELLSEIKSPKAKTKKTKDAPRSPPAALLEEIKSPKKSLKSKSKSRDALPSNRSEDEIIDALAKLINQQLLATDQ